MKISEQIIIGVPEPLDPRFSVKKYSDLAGIINSGLAYKYMRVVVEEGEGYTYELQPDMTTWEIYNTKGPKGDAATIRVGDVREGDTASVVNSGTENDAVFDFVLPKGDPGPALEVGTVELVAGEPSNLEIWKDEDTGKLNFKLTLPSYILGE